MGRHSGERGDAERLHEDQVGGELEVVGCLIDEQFPQWAGLPLRKLPTGGTVNAIFRLGDRLAGVLDAGGFAPADPALDLIVAWYLLESGPRELFRSALPCSDIIWRRGIAWAFEQAMGAAWYYATSHPVMSNWARRTLNRILVAEEYE